jgi:hypothetical protein
MWSCIHWLGLCVAYISNVRFVFPITDDDDKLRTLKQDELGPDSVSEWSNSVSEVVPESCDCVPQ